MMTVSDIFDALSASDRPYKKAVPPDKALDILKLEVRDGMLDPILVDLFIEAKIFEKTRGMLGGFSAG
jgi:HD-GYP domain-containing protein (c-di-GMP phosphodiesterase class II)